jgi:hypothetical protein
MNTPNISFNRYALGLQACNVFAKVEALVNECPIDSDEWLLAQQARALVWVATEVCKDEDRHHAVELSTLDVSMAPEIIRHAEALIADYKPCRAIDVPDFVAMHQAPDHSSKAVRFAQELLNGTYAGVRYIFLFTGDETDTIVGRTLAFTS